MRKTETATLRTVHGPLTFHVRQIDGVQAGRVFLQIAPLVPAIVKAIAGTGLKAEDLKDAARLKAIDLTKVDLQSIGALLSSLTPDTFEAVLVALLSGSLATGTSDQGEPLKIELNRSTAGALFAGQVWELFKLLGLALRLNYLGFLLAAPESE